MADVMLSQLNQAFHMVFVPLSVGGMSDRTGTVHFHTHHFVFFNNRKGRNEKVKVERYRCPKKSLQFSLR